MLIFLEYQRRQASMRSDTSDRSKLIPDDDAFNSDYYDQSKSLGVPAKRDHGSMRSNVSSVSSEPLKITGLSYAFSSTTLPNTTPNTTDEGIVWYGIVFAHDTYDL